MKKLMIIVSFLILNTCTKYRDYANEALNRYCPPELHEKIINAINICQSGALMRGEGMTKDECFAYVAVTFCPPKNANDKM